MEKKDTKKFAKKFLALALAVCMCLGCANLNVYARQEADTVPVADVADADIEDIALDTGKSVTIDESNGAKWFEFVAPEDATYTITSTNNEGDPFGALYQLNVEEVKYELCTSNDDGNDDDGLNFRINYAMSKGSVYYICASMLGSDATGSFTVTINKKEELVFKSIQVTKSSIKYYASNLFDVEDSNDTIPCNVTYDKKVLPINVYPWGTRQDEYGYYYRSVMADESKESDFDEEMPGKYKMFIEVYQYVDGKEQILAKTSEFEYEICTLDDVAAASKETIANMQYETPVSLKGNYYEESEDDGYYDKYYYFKFVPLYSGYHILTSDNKDVYSNVDCENQELGSQRFSNDWNDEIGDYYYRNLKKGQTYYIRIQPNHTETANYTMSYYGGTKKPVASKKVIPVLGLTTDTTKAINVGANTTIAASVSPANATDKALTWTSSNTAVATVDANGKVYGVAAGTATITATAPSGKAASCKVTVSPVYVNGIALNYAAVDVTKGKTVSIVASVSPANVTNRAVTFTSSNPAVATVDAKGIVTGVKAGTADITVTAADGSGVVAVCRVNVVIPATKVAVANKTIYLKKGANTTISTIVTPLDSTDKATFKTSNKKIATVNSKGKVVAKKKGTATITVTAGKKSAKVKVKVVTKTKKATKINITKSKLTVKKGAVQFLKYKVNPTSATQKLTWKSSRKSVVTVDSNGKITAKKKGTATITVSANGKKDTIKITVK